MTKFELYKDIRGYFRWRLKAANGEIVAVSEVYTTMYAAAASAQKVKIWASTARIVQLV